jgi:electron transfer flavoprotein beta subunit
MCRMPLPSCWPPSTPKPPKTAGEKVSDEGEGGKKIAEYLVAQKLI